MTIPPREGFGFWARFKCKLPVYAQPARLRVLFLAKDTFLSSGLALVDGQASRRCPFPYNAQQIISVSKGVCVIRFDTIFVVIAATIAAVVACGQAKRSLYAHRFRLCRPFLPGEAIYAALFDAAPSLQSLFKTPRRGPSSGA